MAVRNPRKAAEVAGTPWSGPKRLPFVGDPAYLPLGDEEPGSSVRKRKPGYEKPRRKSPQHILRGPTHRPAGLAREQFNRDYMLPGGSECRWMPLTKTFKKGG